jgi:hypothetical protein
LLLPVVAYAALKSAVYFGVKTRLEAWQRQVQPLLQSSYGAVKSDLRGAVGVTNIELALGDRSAALLAESLWLQGDSPFFLLDVIRGRSPTRLPNRLLLSLRGVRVADPAAWIALLGAEVGSSASPPAAEGSECGLGRLLRLALPVAEGDWPSWLDLTLEFTRDEAPGEGALDLRLESEGGQGLDLRLALAGIPWPPDALQSPPPAILGLTIALRPDTSRVSRRVAFCATRQGFSRSAYLDNLLGAAPEDLAAELGAIPGVDLRAAIKAYLMAPAEVRLETGALSYDLPVALSEAEPAALLRLVQPRLTVNGAPVRDLSFRFLDRETDMHPRNGDGEDAAAASAKAAPVPVRPGFLVTPVTELHRFLDREVKVFVGSRSQPHRGVLVSVQHEEAAVEKRVMRGRMTVHVPFADIDRVLVLRYPESRD